MSRVSCEILMSEDGIAPPTEGCAHLQGQGGWIAFN